jgi:hypothetical protein
VVVVVPGEKQRELTMVIRDRFAVVQAHRGAITSTNSTSHGIGIGD